MTITTFGSDNRVIKLTVMGIIPGVTAFAVGLHVIKSQFFYTDICLQPGMTRLTTYIHVLTG